MADSAGALDDAFSIYMDSTTAHINQFKAAFTELSSDLMNSDILTFFIDIGTGIVNVIDNIVSLLNKLGGLTSAVVGITAGLSLSNNVGGDKTSSLP